MKYFSFREMVATSTGLPNIPSWQQIECMQQLIVNILDPLRELYGKPIKVTSGFRSHGVNARVKGAKNSDHLYGCAVDLDAGSKIENEKIFNLIKGNFQFKQLINEHGFQWVHVSYMQGRNNLEILKIGGDK